MATEPVSGVASVPRWKNLCALPAGCVSDASQGWFCSNLSFFEQNHKTNHPGDEQRDRRQPRLTQSASMC